MMTQENHNNAIWISIAALVMAIFAAIVSASMAAGSLNTRVDALEKRADLSAVDAVSQAEWKQFASDISGRLSRIEQKLDAVK